MKCVIFLLALTCGALSSPLEDEAIEEFISGNHDFTAAVYKEIAKFEQGNFIVSPISAETVLSLTQEGARGKTASEFVAGLRLPSTPQKTQYAFKYFLPSFAKDKDNFKLFSANKIYFAEEFKIQDNFNDVAKAVYQSGAEHVDFAFSANAAKTINKWVADNTNNKIRDLVSGANFNENTKMVLVNALYFSGEWIHKFDSENTTKAAFYQYHGDSVEVDTMYQVGEFNYYDDPVTRAQFLELPYKGGNISMVIALPYEGEDISSVEQFVEQLVQPHPYKKEKVAVEIPKFKYEGRTEFVPILQNLGIKQAFSKGADFSGISSDDDLFISDVQQKAYISVNEAGTEAAAATEVSIVTTSFDPREPISFKANRPFVYYISYDGVISFIGRINHF